MGQQTGGARLGLEPRQEFWAREACAFLTQPDGLDRNRTPDHRVHGLVHHAHGTAA